MQTFIAYPSVHRNRSSNRQYEPQERGSNPWLQTLSSTQVKGARSAPDAIRRVILHEDAFQGRRGARRRTRGAGASARGDTAAPAWQLRLSTCGARRAAARALPQAPPVTGRPPSRPPCAPTQETAPSSRRSSLGPNKITVKSTPACGLRVLRMALRATLDCDLLRPIVAPIEGMAKIVLWQEPPHWSNGRGLPARALVVRRPADTSRNSNCAAVLSSGANPTSSTRTRSLRSRVSMTRPTGLSPRPRQSVLIRLAAV
jgi:hypothetical protein